MKLSFKFFCIAYLTSLLTISLVGITLIQSTLDEMWNSQIDRVNASQTYTIHTFLSYANYYTTEISPSQLLILSQQIKATTNQDIESLSITPANAQSNHLETNIGVNQFKKTSDCFQMISTCRVASGQYFYDITITSDFTHLLTFQNHLWQNYRFISLVVALFSGLLLYTLTSKITFPLNKLSKTAKIIAKGHYGKTVRIQTNDIEIKQLADNFNIMSKATKQAMEVIFSEAEKQKQFVANFSHEMKTPLTSIIGYVSLLKDYSLTKDEQQEALLAIDYEAKRLDHLALEMLEIFVTQNTPPELTTVSLKEIQKQLNNTCQQLSKKYNVDYTIKLPNLMVQANQDLLLSLLYNLVDNAFKASKNHDTVEIIGFLNFKTIMIVVTDHGSGIDQEHLDRLTEPFYRVDKSRSRSQGGAGLGLAICKEIASIHHSSLLIKSKPGLGTSISFKLRLAGENHEN